MLNFILQNMPFHLIEDKVMILSYTKISYDDHIHIIHSNFFIRKSINLVFIIFDMAKSFIRIQENDVCKSLQNIQK